MPGRRGRKKVRGKEENAKKDKELERQRLEFLYDLDSALSRAVRPGRTRRKLEKTGWLRVFDRALEHADKELGVEGAPGMMPERRVRKTEYDRVSGEHRERFPLVSEKIIRTAPWKVFGLSEKQWRGLSPEVRRELFSRANKMLTEQLVEGLRKMGLNEKSSIDDVRKALTDLRGGRQPAEITVLNIAYYLGVEGASSEKWRLGMKRLVDECRKVGLGPGSSIDDVRRKLNMIMDKEPSEDTVLSVAYYLGVEGASSEKWRLGMKRLVDECRKAGLNENSSIEDVWRVLGDDVSPNTVRDVAKKLGIKVDSWVKYSREYGHGLSMIDKAVDKVLKGGRVQPGRRVWLGEAERLTVGETVIKKWLEQGLSEEEVREKLENAGFKPDEIELLDKYVLKKGKKK